MRFIFFGDSICFGQFVSPHKTWIVKLSEKFETVYGKDFVVMNPSVNGNTTNYTTYRAVTNTSTGVQRCILQSPFNTSYEIHRIYPFPYAEKTDIRWQIASSAAVAAVTNVNIGGVLISNDVSAQF